MPTNQNEASFPEIIYPFYRDGFIKSPLHWIAGKMKTDGAEGLWRIYDKLYDFTDFVKKHPGGELWLNKTKGTDITEAFEVHHISRLPEKLLEFFFVRVAKTKRNSPYTFEENGFYKTLKKRVREDLKHIPKNVNWTSKRIMESLILTTFILALIACNIESFWPHVLLCMLVGVVWAGSTICSHNFIHQKDNWRMYLMSLTFHSVKDFRVAHVLSHHIYPNTLQDLEISFYEPYFQWMTRRTKSVITKYGPIIYSGIFYFFFFDIMCISRALGFIVFRKPAIYSYEDLIPYSFPLGLYLISGQSFVTSFLTWLLALHFCSLVFFIIGLHLSHHHPDLFHDGDEPIKDGDWGLHQLEAVKDRVETKGSIFKVLIGFGDHGLHHLFPAVDHAVLPYFQESFDRTCKEYNTELKISTNLDMFIGSYKQLARTEPLRKSEKSI